MELGYLSNATIKYRETLCFQQMKQQQLLFSNAKSFAAASCSQQIS